MQPITIRQLHFAYPGQAPLFDNCQLDLSSDWRLSLLGRNGRGKTTLMKILQGRLNYQGTVRTNLTFSYFPLTIDDPSAFTIDVLLAHHSDLAQWQIERELGLMDVDAAILWQPYQTLSGGEQTKVQLATIFAQDGVFPLLDEPTNHLDQTGRRQVAHYLSQKDQGFIITSHDQQFLDQVIDHTLVIERQQLVLAQGNYSDYFREKQRRYHSAITTNQQLKSQIQALKQTRQQRMQWAQRAEGEKQHNAHADKGFIGAKASKMMKKTMTATRHLDQAIDQRQGLLQEVETVVPLSINFQPGHQQTVLNLDQVTLSLPGRQLFAPLNLELHRHEQVALVGPNGAGKSSLIKAILGSFPGTVSGQITQPAQVISTVRQNYQGHGSLQELASQHSLSCSDLLNMLRKLGMPRESFDVPIEHMSMGQQKRVELARSLLTPAQVYIWDEPLNYLDTYNQQQLIDLIKQYRTTLLFVEHDQHFIDAVASRVIPVEPV